MVGVSLVVDIISTFFSLFLSFLFYYSFSLVIIFLFASGSVQTQNIKICLLLPGYFFWDNGHSPGPIWRKILRFKPKPKDIFECFEAATNPMDEAETRGTFIGDARFVALKSSNAYLRMRDPTHTRGWEAVLVTRSLSGTNKKTEGACVFDVE